MLYESIRALTRGIFRTLFRYKVAGVENIPEEGPVIICSNHISYIDPPLVGTPLDRRVHFMAKEELFKFRPIGRLLSSIGAFPVRRGGVSKQTIRYALNLLAEGKVMGIFPEGTRNNPGMGRKGAASLAIKSKAAVIPAAIVGSYRPFAGIRIIYGKPLDLSPYYEDSSSEGLEKATEEIMRTIRGMVEANKT